MKSIILLTQCFIAIFSIIKVRGITYPEARRDERVIDIFHGKIVADPYRWLEDPFSEETKKFIEDENKISNDFLRNNTIWKKINDKLAKMWIYPKEDPPFKRGKFYYRFSSIGLKNETLSKKVLYQYTSLNSTPKVFFDPNNLDGFALKTNEFSNRGTLWAYCLSKSGSDWCDIKVRNVETGKDYSETLTQVKFTSLSWTHDGLGFFYNRYDDQCGDGSENDCNINQKVYYHRFGQPQDEDVLAVEFPQNPKWTMKAIVTHCGKYLILTASKNQYVYFADLEKIGPITGKITLTKIVKRPECTLEYIANNGSKMIFRANDYTPNYCIIIIDVENNARKKWTILIKEHPNDVINSAHLVDENKLVLKYASDVQSVLKVYSLETGDLIRNLTFELGSISSFSGDRKGSEIFFKFESYLIPGTIYRYDFSTPDKDPTVYQTTEVNVEGFDPKKYKVDQVHYPSSDGKQISMFIFEKKTESRKSKPTLMNGYGGFNVAKLPFYSPAYLYFVSEFDGIVAIPNIRGGGEYGKRWHNAGRLQNKQKSFDDFQAAAKYLVENKYTEHKKLAIQGGSNGGLLVAVCINQRPDLFGAAIANVGVMDMLRFQKFTIGHSWTSEYGTIRDKEDFEYIYKYSPLHNVHSPNSTENEYPSTLISTGDHDDRASPLHSLKFAAALQHAVNDSTFQKNPILLKVYTNTGHSGSGSSRIGIADAYTFLYKSLGITTSL